MTVIDRMKRNPLTALDRTVGRETVYFDRGPDWMFDDRRGCAPGKVSDPGVFTSDDRQQQREAKKICRRCPFRAECDEWATQAGEKHFVWGGKVRSHKPRKDDAA